MRAHGGIRGVRFRRFSRFFYAPFRDQDAPAGRAGGCARARKNRGATRKGGRRAYCAPGDL